MQRAVLHTVILSEEWAVRDPTPPTVRLMIYATPPNSSIGVETVQHYRYVGIPGATYLIVHAVTRHMSQSNTSTYYIYSTCTLVLYD